MTLRLSIRMHSVLPLLATAQYGQSVNEPTPPPKAEVIMALGRLLPDQDRNEDIVEDLYAAAAESFRRRKQNSHDGGVVIAALRNYGQTWKQIRDRTGIPTRTARRWRTPPPEHPTEE